MVVTITSHICQLGAHTAQIDHHIYSTVKPALKTTRIKRPPAYEDYILQVPRGILSMLLSQYLRTTCV